MEVTTNYISCACNPYPHTVDWGKNRLICYASSHSVVIYDPYAGGEFDTPIGKVLNILNKHLTPVKSVQWIKTAGIQPETEIVSGSLDGTVVVWKKNDHDSFEVNCTIKTEGTLTLTRAHYMTGSKETSSLIGVASSNDKVSIFHRNPAGDIVDEGDLRLNKKFPINIQFFDLPTSTSGDFPALIVTTDDNMIHLFAWNNQLPGPLDFQHVIELKGHEDWIQALDVIQIDRRESFIASGSQDGMIRLWKCSLLNESRNLIDEITPRFVVGNCYYYVSLESVIRGHGDWVYGLHWHPPLLDENGKVYESLKLLSCGLDKTVIIWQESFSRVWVETVKLGNIEGNATGYYGCRFNENGSSVLAYGYQGSFHIWKMTENYWLPRSAPSGHFSEVNDLAWESQGRYLITTSLDQTTRIHVPWDESSANDPIWHEISRPQIHGYDNNVIAILSATRFASGADEKVVRIFEAPTNFIKALNTGNWTNFKNFKDMTSVPALGLTNKVVDNEAVFNEFRNESINPRIPPTENEIVTFTLWPELEKLYGHGYEIFAMAATHDGKFLATSCKSNSQEFAAIIIWNMKTFSQVQQLIYHRLTITQLEFSPDDKYLVSVSRDRKWGLYYRSDESSDDLVNYKLVAKDSSVNSFHTRIIWCCSWTHDSKYFATGSRDGTIGIWNISENHEITNSGRTERTSVTALAFSKAFLEPRTYILAIGYDDGVIEIQKIVDIDVKDSFVSCGKLENSRGHHKTVKRLAFRPHKSSETLQLASCSADWTVKIYTLYSENLKKFTN